MRLLQRATSIRQHKDKFHLLPSRPRLYPELFQRKKDEQNARFSWIWSKIFRCRSYQNGACMVSKEKAVGIINHIIIRMENTTDDFASQARSPLIKEIHKRVTEVKESKEMEVEYMTLLQRDRENLELGTTLATKIIKLYHKGISNEEIASSLQLDLEYVDSVISDYEND